MRSKILASLFLCFCLGSCEWFNNLNSSADTKEEDHTSNYNSDHDEYYAKTFSQEYQGTWKREDTGEEWVISSNSIHLGTNYSDRVSTKNKTLELLSADRIKVTEGSDTYFLNKKRGT